MRKFTKKKEDLQLPLFGWGNRLALRGEVLRHPYENGNGKLPQATRLRVSTDMCSKVCERARLQGIVAWLRTLAVHGGRLTGARGSV